MEKTRVFAISGFSGSGKTTLLSMLIKKLREQGNSVGVIKNSKEDILAPVGTDTRLHQDAGGDPVVLLGPDTTTTRNRKRKELIEILNEVNADYILLEGFKNLTIPRFWCISNSEKIPETLSDVTKAVVGWFSPKTDFDLTEIPYLTHTDVKQLLGIIESTAPTVDEIRNMI